MPTPVPPPVQQFTVDAAMTFLPNQTAVQGARMVTLSPAVPATETVEDVRLLTAAKFTVNVMSVRDGTQVDVNVTGDTETLKDLAAAVLHVTRTSRDAVNEYWTENSEKGRAGT